MVVCTDETLDWALEEAEDAGQLNTWVCGLIAVEMQAVVLIPGS
jgi:hypothetical protein